jgi:mannosyltransferase
VSVTAAIPGGRGRAPSQPAVSRRRSALALGALTVLAAALRFALIGHQGYWFDEGNTVLLVHFSPGKMLGLIPQTESTPPLYYCVAWVWARIFGFGEPALRSLSALAGVATVPVLYAAASRLASPRAGLLAAALAACNPLLVWYSQEARAYALLVALSATSILAFAWALERPTARTAALWALSCVLALATHYYAVLAVAPEAVWLLYRHRRSRAIQLASAAVVALGAALLPYALGQNATGHANWIAQAPLGRRLGQLVPQFVAGFALPADAVLEPLAVAVAAGALAFGLIGGAGRVPEQRLARIGGAVALAGLALNLLLVAAGIDDLLTRNLLALWPPAALAVAGGLALALSLARARALGAAAALMLCAIGVAGVVDFDVNRGLQRPDWRVVARVLDERAPGSAFVPPTAGAIVPVAAPRPRAVGAAGRLILIQHYRDLLPLSLYLPRLKFLHGSGARVSELDVISFTSPPSAGFCWWGSGCNLWPSRMQRSYPIPGFRAVSRTRRLQFTILRMVAARPERVTTAELARALRGTTLREDDLLFQRS